MAKFDKEPKKKKTNKYLTEAQVVEIQGMTNQQLLRAYLVHNRLLRKYKKLQKEDPVIIELKEKIKEHRETTVSEQTRDEMKKLKDKLKEIRDEIDVGLEDILQELKDKNTDYKEDKGVALETLKLVQQLLDTREPS